MQVFYRSLRLVIHILVGLILAAAVELDWRQRLKRERLMSWWCAVLLDILGIQLSVHGSAHDGAHMTVANHVSWLDIIVIGACEPTRFVAKSEIRHWPVAGWLANGTGAFYIRRGKGGARPLLHQLIPHLQNNGCVCVFPEGTTTGGDNVLPFHPRLFAAAIEARCPVQPVAIRYGRAGNGEAIAPFVGDDELVSHVLRILKEPELFAEINYCPPFSPAGLKREQLASAAHGAVAAIIAPARFLQPEPALESVLA